MKITALNVLVLSHIASTVGADSSFVGAGAAESPHGGQYNPVSINVYCNGVDWKGLTAVEDDFSAGVLMESYNIVHQALDGGDYYLSKVHFEGITTMGTEDSAEDDVLESDDEDEALEEDVLGATKRNSLHYTGGAGCNLCAADAAAMFVELGRAAPSLVAWEKEFKDLLTKGPHSALHGANKCKITMVDDKKNVAASDLDDASVTDTSHYSPVSIDVYCKGVDWNGLTAEEDDFSAVVLMEAYNIVHQALDGGDYYLAKVHFEGITTMGLEDSAEDDVLESNDEDEVLEEGVLRATRRKSLHYTGGAGCYLCASAAAMFVELGRAAPSLVAWEKEFKDLLTKGPHSALHGANKCKITMSSETQDAPAPAPTATVNDKTENVASSADTPASSLRGFTIHATTVVE